MKKKSENQTPLKDYARYSSLAIQMILIILIGTFAGIKLDQWIQLSFPIFKIIFPIASVFLALYVALKDFLKKK
ncbi:AtpZ/AtpI family protein [Bacteroidales bacterium OttesenSCG-928-C19]|nr:AtpZ/AtpI family protein [Bacteroidales bacterium OttesenSCG-928-C19]